jgi:uncharacterized membrane protein YeaQ/YmgE (transglycosylase-associated protein family)
MALHANWTQERRRRLPLFPAASRGTIVLGIVGSFVGGFLQRLVEYHTLEVHHFYTTGIIGSIIGAVVVLLLLRLTGTERGRSRRRRI